MVRGHGNERSVLSNGDLNTGEKLVEVSFDELSPEDQRFFSRRKKLLWQLWYAVQQKLYVTYTGSPTLFEVFWVPALCRVARRSFKPAPGDATVWWLWKQWCLDHSPRYLRKRVAELKAKLDTARKQRDEAVDALRQYKRRHPESEDL